jgi:hypothetical protein
LPGLRPARGQASLFRPYFTAAPWSAAVKAGPLDSPPQNERPDGFDLATPFYQGVYEMHHLPIPASLQSNIEYRFYDSGHMVYAKDSSLKRLHENVANFIRRTSNLGN